MVEARIKEYLDGHGITQAWLSKKINMSKGVLSTTLSGKRRLTLDEYETVCWALGVSPDTFLEARKPDCVEA